METFIKEFEWEYNTPPDHILLQVLWDKGGSTTKMCVKFPQLRKANSVDNVWFLAHAEGSDDDHALYAKVFKPILDVINKINSGRSALRINAPSRPVELPQYYQDKIFKQKISVATVPKMRYKRKQQQHQCPMITAAEEAISAAIAGALSCLAIAAAPAKAPVIAAPDETSLIAAPDETSLIAAPDETALKAAPDETALIASPNETSLIAAPDETALKAAPDKTALIAAPDETALIANTAPAVALAPKESTIIGKVFF